MDWSDPGLASDVLRLLASLLALVSTFLALKKARECYVCKDCYVWNSSA